MSLLSHGGNFVCLSTGALKVRVFKSEIDSVSYRQGFVGISTVEDLSERGPEYVSANGSFTKMFKRPK